VFLKISWICALTNFATRRRSAALTACSRAHHGGLENHANWVRGKSAQHRAVPREAAAQMAVGKISCCRLQTPRISARKWRANLASALGLDVVPGASQGIQRDRHAYFQRPRAHRRNARNVLRSKFGISAQSSPLSRRPFSGEQARQVSASPHNANPRHLRTDVQASRAWAVDMLAAFENTPPGPLARARLSHIPSNASLPDSTILVD